LIEAEKNHTLPLIYSWKIKALHQSNPLRLHKTNTKSCGSVQNINSLLSWPENRTASRSTEAN